MYNYMTIRYTMMSTSTIPRTSSGAVGCSHVNCNRRWSSPYSARPAIDVVFEPARSNDTIGLLLTCANHRRAIRMQQGRGSRDYTRLILSGIDPQQGDMSQDWPSLIEAAEAQARTAAEARERAAREAFERDRPAILELHNDPSQTLSYGVAPTLEAEDRYGRRFIRVGAYGHRLTPVQARLLARELISHADRADSQGRGITFTRTLDINV